MTNIEILGRLNQTELKYLISKSHIGYAEFVYATKLQSLKLGDSSMYYSNGNLQTLYLGNNKLLKTLDVRNCTGLDGVVN